MLEDPKARHGWTPAVRIVASLKTFGKEKQWYFGMLQRGPFHKECAKHKPLSQLKFQPPATSTGSRDLQYIMECMWRGEAQKNKSCVTSISRQSTHFFQFYPYALDQYKLLLHLWLTLAQSLTQAHTHTHTHACMHARTQMQIHFMWLGFSQYCLLLSMRSQKGPNQNCNKVAKPTYDTYRIVIFLYKTLWCVLFSYWSPAGLARLCNHFTTIPQGNKDREKHPLPTFIETNVSKLFFSFLNQWSKSKYRLVYYPITATQTSMM